MSAADGGALPRAVATAEEIEAVRGALVVLLPELRAYARFMMRDRTVADDAVQEALVRAIAALPQIAAGTDGRAWMFAILRNVIFAQVRRGRRDRTLAAMSAAASETAMPPRQMDALAIQDLAAMLRTLPPIFREALVLVGAQGFSHEEAAGIAAVGVGTMKMRVSRARALLADRHGPR